MIGLLVGVYFLAGFIVASASYILIEQLPMVDFEDFVLLTISFFATCVVWPFIAFFVLVYLWLRFLGFIQEKLR